MTLYERLRLDESGVGKESGGWTRIGPSFRLRRGKQKKTVAVFQCKCSRVSLIEVDSVKRGISNECGERQRQKFISTRTKHGCYKAPEYAIWEGIVQRCANPNAQAYEGYGGRGIQMRQRWRDSFAAFLEDMGSRPTPEHEIDRRDNNGHYEPGNCRWVTHRENMRNKRDRRTVAYNGVSMSLVELAELCGMPKDRLRCRLNTGMSAEEATKAPLYYNRRRGTQGNRGGRT